MDNFLRTTAWGDKKLGKLENKWEMKIKDTREDGKVGKALSGKTC